MSIQRPVAETNPRPVKQDADDGGGCQPLDTGPAVVRLWVHPEQRIKPRMIGIGHINWQTSLEYDLTVDELRGRCRSRRVCAARHEAWRRCHMRGYSLAEIGRYYHRDHGTIMNGLRMRRRPK